MLNKVLTLLNHHIQLDFLKREPAAAGSRRSSPASIYTRSAYVKPPRSVSSVSASSDVTLAYQMPGGRVDDLFGLSRL